MTWLYVTLARWLLDGTPYLAAPREAVDRLTMGLNGLDQYADKSGGLNNPGHIHAYWKIKAYIAKLRVYLNAVEGK